MKPTSLRSMLCKYELVVMMRNVRDFLISFLIGVMVVKVKPDWLHRKPEFNLPISKSLVISKLSQLLAMLGATLRRLGTIPL